MEEHDRNNLEKIKKLFEQGQNIGALFTSDVDLLIEKHKDDLGLDDNYIHINSVQMKQLGSAILNGLYNSRIHPFFWNEMLLMLSRHVELLISEAGRIKKEHDNG